MIKSYGIIPLKGRQVYLVRHANGGHWGFPKGRPEEGETPLESAKRELVEETGLVVERLLTNEPLIEKRPNKWVYFYPALVSGQVSVQPEEVLEGRWVDKDEVLSLLDFPEAQEVYQTFMQQNVF